MVQSLLQGMIRIDIDGECKMNSSTKISLVSSIFVIAGLCGSLSYAAPEVESASELNIAEMRANIQNISMNSSVNDITYSYAFPSITSEVFASNKKINIPSFSNISRQPLQGIQVADFARIDPNRLQKKNAIFEFAAKFNDKLQQILAVFDFSSSNVMTSKESISQQSKKRKVHLKSNIGNCIASKK